MKFIKEYDRAITQMAETEYRETQVLAIRGSDPVTPHSLLDLPPIQTLAVR